MGKKALVIIDVQNDFCPDGTLAVPEGDAIFAPVNQLISRHDHIIVTQDWHPANHISFASSHQGNRPYDRIQLAYGSQTLWPDHCVQGTTGANIHPAIDITRAELILRKGYNPSIDSYSAFYENDRKTPTGLASYLKERGINELTFCGLATDFCVAYSALDGVQCGFQSNVILEACRAIDINGSFNTALQTMQTHGVKLLLTA